MLFSLKKLISQPSLNMENQQAHSQFLHQFRSEIWNFITQRTSESESLSLEFLQACLDLVRISNGAFDALLLEINYSKEQWGGQTMDVYLNYTLDLMDLLNLITSAISSLNQARLSILLKRLPSAVTQGRIPGRRLSREFKLKTVPVPSPSGKDNREYMILQAVMVLKKIGFLVLGFVLSGLWSDEKPYLKIQAGLDDDGDQMVKALDSMFFQGISKIQGGLAEVNEATRAVEGLSPSARKGQDPVRALERSIRGIEKQANDLFTEVLAARNALLNRIRLQA